MLPSPLDDRVATQSGLACLAVLLQYFRMPANLEQLQREFGGAAVDSDVLVRLLRTLGLKSRQIDIQITQLVRTPLPAIAELCDGQFVVIGNIADDQVLIQDSVSGDVNMLPIDAFYALWSGRLILASKRVPLFGQGGKFDLSGFIPAVRRKLNQWIPCSPPISQHTIRAWRNG